MSLVGGEADVKLSAPDVVSMEDISDGDSMEAEPCMEAEICK
jgi:hypothetical protein